MLGLVAVPYMWVLKVRIENKTHRLRTKLRVLIPFCAAIWMTSWPTCFQTSETTLEKQNSAIPHCLHHSGRSSRPPTSAQTLEAYRAPSAG